MERLETGTLFPRKSLGVAAPKGQGGLPHPPHSPHSPHSPPFPMPPSDGKLNIAFNLMEKQTWQGQPSFLIF
ncbi:MAG: hypothetical protein F6J93_21695 [Oscillatoria sp. SIO1A7]|nr:hypothetical protein [Oscillatoria sp. SIO1A7]